MLRWFVIFLVFLLNIGRVQAARETSIYTVTYRSKHPEYSWLKRFLRLRGYKPTQQSGSTLSLKLLPGSKVLMMRGQRSQQYNIPAQVTSPVTRARMCVMYLDMFLDSLHRQPKPAPKPTLVKQKTNKPTIVKRRRYQRRLAVRKSMIRRRTRRRRMALAVRRQTNKPVVRVIPVVRKASIRSSSPSVSTPIKRSVVRRKVAIVSRKKPKPRPKQVPKPRKRKTKVASLSAVAKVGVRARVAPSRRIQIWGDISSLDLGLSGGFRWSNESVAATVNRIMGGGSVLFGFNTWRWTLRIDLNFHSYFLQKQSRTLAFVRPSFWLGYRIPLGKGERYLHLYAMVGVGTDLFVEEKSDSYKTILHWGVGVALQLHWNITKRWSLFLRPALFVFPGGFGISPLQEVFLSAPTVQVSGMVGLQVRF